MQAKSTFYYKNGSIIEEYILGRIYTGYNSEKCIKAWFETVEPFKVDTMSNRYQFRMCTLKSNDSILFCK